MDTNATFGIALAEKEDLLSQMEAIEARLRALDSYIEQHKPVQTVNFDAPFSTIHSQQKSRKPAITTAVVAMLRAAGRPMLMSELLAGLAARGLIDASSVTDKGYARATIQRMREHVVYDKGKGCWSLMDRSAAQSPENRLASA